jgi:hypothetical protein
MHDGLQGVLLTHHITTAPQQISAFPIAENMAIKRKNPK